DGLRVRAAEVEDVEVEPAVAVEVEHRHSRTVDLRRLPQVYVAAVVDEAEADLVGHVLEPGFLVPGRLSVAALEALAEDRTPAQQHEEEQAEAGDPDFEASSCCHPVPLRKSMQPAPRAAPSVPPSGTPTLDVPAPCRCTSRGPRAGGSRPARPPG